MSRSTERVLHKFFGFYTTKLGHRRRPNSSFRSLEKVNGVFGFWRENLRMDPLIFHSSSGKPMAAGESLAGLLRYVPESQLLFQNRLFGVSIDCFWCIEAEKRVHGSKIRRFRLSP